MASARRGGEHAPRLTLETLAEPQPYIVIDGVSYEYIDPQDMSLVQQARWMQLVREYSDIRERAEQLLSDAAADELTEDDAVRLSDLARELVGQALPLLPDETLDALTDTKRMAIITDFQRARAVTPAPLAPAQATRQRKTTGASSSRASRARTTGSR